ncbi:diphosphomevalonate decarboxylase [Amycolatopsis sp. NPDC054798]
MPADFGVTAVAYPNIALVKYWGKRDENQIIPWADSLSVTLDCFPTTTTVHVRPEADADCLTFDGRPADRGALQRVTAFLDVVRKLAGRAEPAMVATVNAGPTAAGLASSASGFAALAGSAAAAYGLELDGIGLSRLARRGSGSAARSVFGGFSLLHAGEDDHSSFAEPIRAEVDLAIVIVLTGTAPKTVSSRAAMRHTVETSPLYWSWIESGRDDLAAMRDALGRGDLVQVGEIAERNALGMHATMLAARPAVRYLSPSTLVALDGVAQLRRDGIPAYATMDAGPNVKVLCRPEDAGRVVGMARDKLPDCPTAVARRGPGVSVRIEEAR